MTGPAVRILRRVRAYGANPLHLLVLLAALAVAGYAAVRLLDGPALRITGWFVAAAVAHDLLLFPLYALADAAGSKAARRGRPARPASVPWINHVRFPAVVSGVLLLVWLPLILRLPAGYRGITGYTTDPYLGRWLLVTGALFLVSAVAYAVRLRRSRRAH